MIRILLFVMFAALLLTNPSVNARKANPAPATDGNTTASQVTGSRAETSAHGIGRRMPTREARVGSGSPRPSSLRWHSFLPGMFR